MTELVFGGFGGQGVLLGGQVLAHIAMGQDYQVTWMPAYGPTMRGGTANCVVKYDHKIISNPSLEEIDILIAMNEPALLKYQEFVVPGGLILVNANTTKERTISRSDVRAEFIPCVEMAAAEKNLRGANFVMLGAAVKLANLFPHDVAADGLADYFREKGKEKTVPANLATFNAGYNLF